MSCHTPATEWCRPFALAARAAAKVAPDEIAQLEVILDEHQNAIAADDSERVAPTSVTRSTVRSTRPRTPTVSRSRSSPWSRIAEPLLRHDRGPGLRHPHQAPLLLDALRSHQVRRARSLMEHTSSWAPTA